MALVTPVAVVLVGGADGGIFAFFCDQDEVGGISEAKRTKQNGVDDAEDGGVGANSEGERQNSDQRECGALGEEAKRVAEILQQSLHRSPHRVVVRCFDAWVK